MLRRIFLGVVVLLVAVTAWLLTTNDPRIWPYRNGVQYVVYKRLGWLDQPVGSARGAISGVVRSTGGQPIANARVLVAWHDGTAWSAESDRNGRYTIADVAAGTYTPIAGAPGYADAAIRTVLGTRVAADQITPLDVTLQPRPVQRIPPATDVRLDDPLTLSVQQPLPATAVRRELHFAAGDRPNQPTWVYTPNDGQNTPLPVLIAVYPGPADTWEIVSLPLAQAGYVVIAAGPAYALDLENDIDDLERVIDLVKTGQIPRADPQRIGALGGSYSSIHVMRLAVRDPQAVRAALLLGPPTDGFELRRQLEAGTFKPPFGLDQALIALGLPDRQPELPWRYSVRYHARNIQIPVMLIHSKQDEVVPFTQSQVLADEFARVGVRHELIILEGLGHYLYEPEYAAEVGDLFKTTTDFFARELR